MRVPDMVWGFRRLVTLDADRSRHQRQLRQRHVRYHL